jgi:hypothetical protein
MVVPTFLRFERKVKSRTAEFRILRKNDGVATALKAREIV